MNKSILNFPFLLFLMCLLGCKSKTTVPETFEIASEKVYSVFFVDSVFEHIRFIPLETNNENLISSIFKFDKLDSNYVVIDREQVSIFLFSATGKFKRKIGQKGKGKFEYTQLRDMSVSNDSLYVVVNEGKHIYIYNKNGDFIRQENLKFIVSSFAKLNDGYLFYTGYINSKPTCTHRLIFTDNTLTPIDKWLETPYGNNQYLISSPNSGYELTQTQNGYLLMEPHNPILYKFGEDKKLSKMAQINIDGSADLLSNIMADTTIQNKDMAMDKEKGSIRMRRLVEMGNFIFISYVRNSNGWCLTACIDKRKKKQGYNIYLGVSKKYDLSVNFNPLPINRLSSGAFAGDYTPNTSFALFQDNRIKASKNKHVQELVNYLDKTKEPNPVIVEFN
ncbi:MAG TPA: 6-bladed beta-propeller [Bacteroidales bacterium]|nr:6-bladed beta-propeller [Bacteroidales bacterium]